MKQIFFLIGSCQEWERSAKWEQKFVEHSSGQDQPSMAMARAGRLIQLTGCLYPECVLGVLRVSPYLPFPNFEFPPEHPCWWRKLNKMDVSLHNVYFNNTGSNQRRSHKQSAAPRYSLSRQQVEVSSLMRKPYSYPSWPHFFPAASILAWLSLMVELFRAHRVLHLILFTEFTLY